MARGSEIRYVQFYTDGSAARQLEVKSQPKKKPQQPRPRRRKKIVLRVDFVAVAGMLVTGIMLLMMLSGMASLNKINAEVTRLEGYLAELEGEITTIRMILTGRLAGIEPQVIKERLRDLYA